MGTNAPPASDGWNGHGGKRQPDFLPSTGEPI
jgi:hypothetical protein